MAVDSAGAQLQGVGRLPRCLRVLGNKLGINNPNPVATLDVVGNIKATGSIVGLAVLPPVFVAGDKYLVVDASGNIHRSALGPGS